MLRGRTTALGGMLRVVSASRRGAAAAPRVRELREKLKSGPALRDFASPAPAASSSGLGPSEEMVHPTSIFADSAAEADRPRRVFIETYGCQMNVADSEVVRGVLGARGYEDADSVDDANVVFVNTCAIRENAENKVWTRLRQLRSERRARRRNGGDFIVGVLGACPVTPGAPFHSPARPPRRVHGRPPQDEAAGGGGAGGHGGGAGRVP